MTTTSFQHNLTIGHCNIQGGLTGIGKSQEIIQLIRDHNIDILSLNETNLKSDIDTNTLNLPTSYDFIRKDRGSARSRGGCGILINCKCEYTEINMETSIKNIEAIWVKLNKYNIYICGFYRSSNFCNIDIFLDYMTECMAKLNSKNVIWIGDINIDQNNIKDPSYKKLDMTLKSYNMVQTIQDYTRVAKLGDKITATTIDVIMTNCYSKFTSCDVLNERLGDHQVIKCELDLKVKKAPKHKQITIRDHCKRNIGSFVVFLENSDYRPIMECDDAEIAAVALNNHLNNHYDKYFPYKNIKKHENYIHKPSPDLLHAIRLKSKLYKKFKKKLNKVKDSNPSCNNCNTCIRCINCNNAWNEYKQQRNLVKKISNYNKRQNILNDLKEKSNKNDLKGIWKTIKTASNLSSNGNKPSNEKNVSITPDEINEHFSTIGSKIQIEIPKHDNIKFSDFLPPRDDDKKFSVFKEISIADVQVYFDKLPSDKSVFDDIPLKIFKSTIPIIIEPLTHIINLSLSTGIVPSFCKFAKVTPILKGGNIDDANNYRPISILPIIAKSIEYFVNEQLTEYMEENELLTNQQYGFRKNYSTTYLMLDLFDEIYKTKSQSKRPALIFLDIKKAFDTVNHNILFSKLKYYGIDGVVLKWFKNYLTGRHQCTKLGGNISKFHEILCGVPQGSILGPILFSIFINDITFACNLSKPYFFADDGALLFDDICRKTYLNMKIELLTIMKWLDVNKLSLSIQKTSFMVFDNIDECDEIFLSENVSIKECKSTKYLGLIVDHKLKFSDHIDHVKTKISKRIGAMYRSKNLLPLKYRKMFANALMLPQFDYLDIIYSKTSKSRLNELDILYKKVAKIALNVPTTESSLNVYSEMKWLPLHLRRQLHLSSYMFRIIKNQSPTNFMNKFKYISGGSRNANNCNLYINKSKTHKEFSYLGAKCWNNISNELRNMEDVKVFSKCYKTRMLQSIINDPNYCSNNDFDIFYKPAAPSLSDTSSDLASR